MATFTGAGVAMRDEYHQARKRARVEREEWAQAAVDDGSLPLCPASASGPIGPARYGNALQPIVRTEAAPATEQASEDPSGGDAANPATVDGDGRMAPQTAEAGCDADANAAWLGKHVLLRDLVSTAHLNGRMGRVRRFDDERDRFEVELEAPAAGFGDDELRVVRVRRANVELSMGASGEEMQQRAAPGGGCLAVARRAAFLAEIEREEAEFEAEGRARLRGDAAIAAINELPLPEAGDRHATFKLRAVLQCVTRQWLAYLEVRSELRARLQQEATEGPTWQETVGWARWLLTSRAQSSAADPALIGRTRDTVEVYLKHAMGHIWRLLYPRMEGMAAPEWRSYWELVLGKLHGFFTDEGRRKWAEAAGAEAMALERNKGGGEAAQRAAREEAVRRVRDGLQAAMGHARARQHALLSDVYLAQDLLLCEAVQARARC